MNRAVLFVVAEAGPAAYLAPLWHRWLERGATGWAVLTDAAARRRIEATVWPAEFPVFAAGEGAEEPVSQAIHRIAPKRLVVSATGHGIEAAAIGVARSLGLGVVQFIDAWYGYKRRLHAHAMADLIYVIDQTAVQEAADEGLPAHLLVPIGHPAWEAARPLPPAPADRATFLSAPVAQHYGQKLGYDERDAWDMAQRAARTWPALVSELVFAAHPAQTAEIERGCPYGETAIATAGTVFGMFAAPMVNALLGGRRVISLQPGAVEPDFCPLSRHGRIPRATTMDELQQALSMQAPVDPIDLRAALTGSCERWARALGDTDQ